MENTQELLQEVSDIYKTIEDREVFLDQLKPTEKFSKLKRASSLLLILSLACILSAVLVLWLEPISSNFTVMASATLLLCGYGLIFITTIIDILQFKDDIKIIKVSSILILLDNFYRSAEEDVQFAQKLKQYSTAALLIVKNRLSSQYTIATNRLGSLVGSLNKLGLLPGLLAIIITLLNQNYHQVTIPIAVFFFAIYITTFRFHFDLPRIHFYVQMLEDEVNAR